MPPDMPIDILIQVTLGGVLIGGLYALVAFGLSLIYGVARILNFSHGTLLTMAGIAASVAFVDFGWPLAVCVLVIVPVFFTFGYGFHAVMLRPLASRPPFEATVGTVLITVGTLIVLSDLAAALAGPNPRNIPLRSGILEFGEVILPTTQIGILGGIALLTVAIHLFLKRSWFGRAIRAVTQDPTGAAICGVRAKSIHALTFAVGSALVAVAGVLYALSYPVDPYMGFSLTVKAFTIIVLGGVGNLIGALLAGLFLGVAEAYTAFFWAPEWAPALSILLLLGILIMFPQGIASWRKA